jgi:hypothetical protein
MAPPARLMVSIEEAMIDYVKLAANARDCGADESELSAVRRPRPAIATVMPSTQAVAFAIADLVTRFLPAASIAPVAARAMLFSAASQAARKRSRNLRSWCRTIHDRQPR